MYYLSAMFNLPHLLGCVFYCHSSLCSSTDSLDPWPHFAGSPEGNNVLCHACLVETFGWTGYLLGIPPIYSIKRRPAGRKRLQIEAFESKVPINAAVE